MRRNRLTALLLTLCMALEPLAFAQAEAEHQHDAETTSYVVQETAIVTEDGQALPQQHTPGSGLRVAMSDESAVSYWQYAIDYIGYSETFAADQSIFGADANDADTVVIRALKGWRISDGVPVILRITALDKRKNVLGEAAIPLLLQQAHVVQVNGLPLPESIAYGELLTIAASNDARIARWQYRLSTPDGASLASTTASSADVSKALTGCMQSALRWGDVDLTQPLVLTITGYNAESAAVTQTAELCVSFANAEILAAGGAAVPGFMTADMLLGKASPVTLRTVSGGNAVWTIRAFDQKGVCIGEETSEPCSEKTVLYGSLIMTENRFSRHIKTLEITASENGAESAPVSITIGFGCPACGEELTRENAHYVRTCGHYRCDGYDHYPANCHQDGHCNAYHVNHTIKCASCRVRLCSADGYNPENCHECSGCCKALCISQDLDHTICEGCGKCHWYTKMGKHETCGYCGMYLCTEEGRAVRHDVLTCGDHASCANGGIYHKRGACGVAGHYTCDGSNHDACPTCRLYACTDEYAALNHDACEICGMRLCNKNYTWAAHQLCAHCGDWLCTPGTDHRQHNCGVEGHYRCDGRWHNADLIDKYCDATPQHRKCQGMPQHYCDEEDGGCGQNYPCSQSNRHTRCTMCGLRWCDRSNGGHETPCGVRTHRPCQLSGFRYSEHLDCEFCGNPKCVGLHATCGDPFVCDKCYAKYYKPNDHTRPCGHLKCAKGEHDVCPECEGFLCDTTVHVTDPRDGVTLICTAPKPSPEPSPAP